MNDWKFLSLLDAGIQLIDCVHKTPPAVGSGLPYVAIPQMKNGELDLKNARKISFDDYQEWTKKARPQPNDMVLSRRCNPGETAFVREGMEFALGQNLVLLRADDKQVKKEFLRWLVRSHLWWEQIEKFKNVGAVFDSLRCADVPKFELPIPPLDEQRDIAEILGALDDKIEINRRMNDTLEAMARSIFKDWFVDYGPTRAKVEGCKPYLAPEIWDLFPDALDDDDKPVGWSTGSLDGVANSPRTGVQPSDVSSDTPYLGLEHMPRRSIALTDWESAGKVTSSKCAFLAGDFLFGKLRPYFHKVGVAPLDGICSTDIVVVRPKAEKWRAFTIACISTSDFVDYTDRTSTGTKMPRTNWKTMGRYECIIPDGPVVRSFDEIVWPMVERITTNIRENQTLAQTRDLLLPKLISGKIRLSDAEKEVETVG